MRTLKTNSSNRQDNQKFLLQGARTEEFCAEMSEVEEKPEIEIEIKISIPEAAPILDEPITTVERDRQNQEARTEAKIDRTRVVSSSQK